ncbi:MAG: cytochrome c oxidase subunit II [Gemmatimonadota bacterium]
MTGKAGRIYALCVMAMLPTACRGPQSALDPYGPAAERILILFGVFLAVSAAFALALWIPLVQGAIRRGTARISERRALQWVLVAGAALPALTVVSLFVYSVVLHGSLSPTARAADLTIQVNAHQWWWSVRYLSPAGGAPLISANELHIPVGRRVEVLLTSSDVIHSFWVPALHGKTDMIPGRTTVTWIEADKPGVYRGQCAEFCGLQHARMALHVIAHPENEFESWLAAERRPAMTTQEPNGERVFMQLCAACHTVRGSAARGVLGPDLTHFASRGTIAAGTLPNDADALAAWVSNPQTVKRGNHMPKLALSASQLQHVVAYLQGLR